MGKLTAVEKRANNILNWAMIFGLMISAGVIYYLIYDSSNLIYSYSSMFFIISSVLVLISLLFGSKIYNINVNNASKRTFGSHEEAAANFRSANMIKWGLVHVASTIAIILAFLESNLLTLIPVMVGIVYLYVSRMNELHFGNYRY